MQTFVIITEADFKRWVREAMQDCLKNSHSDLQRGNLQIEEPIGRKDVAKLLNISLVTLHNRIKQGLPFYKQGRNVYFIKSEVLEHLRKTNGKGLNSSC